MMKAALAVLALVAVLAAVGANAKLLPVVADQQQNDAALRQQFADFKVTYARKYKSAEEEARAFAAFGRNMQRAHELNALHKGQATFGVTRFMDMESVPKGARPAAKKTAGGKIGKVPTEPKLGAIPSVFSWVKQGAVFPPGEGEGQCGGGNPAMSAIDNIEGVNFVTNGKLVALSAQEFVACDTYDYGCNGGLMTNMFEWAIHENGGKIYTNASMPYASGNGSSPACNTTGAVVGATLSGYVEITPKDAAAIQRWSYGYGPITTGVDPTALQTYVSGVVRASACPNPNIEIAVTIVGWNDDTNPPYWICKNSWGKWWGSNGYFYIEKGVDACAIEEMASTAFVEKTSN